MQCIIIYWRDIPSQVVIKRGRNKGKALLSARFQKAIDRAAMRAGKGSSDAYLAEWRRQISHIETEEALDTCARREAERLEQCFDDSSLLQMIRNQGFADIERQSK